MTTILILLAAFLGGVSNALVGGGQFLVFPALLMSGIPPVQANATASLVVLPGAFVSAWVYRDAMGSAGRTLLVCISLTSLIGSAIGGLLMLATGNSTFSALVPWLLLMASAVFTAAPWLRGFASKRQGHESLVAVAVSQTIIAIYGGYFGAGMGVFMLAVYLVATKLDVQSANAVRMLSGCVINPVAVLIFASRGALVYKAGVPMLIAAVLGGYAGAMAVKRLNPNHARIVMLAYAWGLTAWFFVGPLLRRSQ